MKKKIYQLYQKNFGFTLIELIVVMGILGLLAVIGLGSFRSSQIKGRDAQRKNDLSQLQRALEAYFNDKGKYPEVADLPSSGAEWRDPTGTLYMKTFPNDPRGPDYLYEYFEVDGTAYKIFAFLENPKDKDIETCIIDLSKTCGTQTCNYGVSSANLDVCVEPTPSP